MSDIEEQFEAAVTVIKGLPKEGKLTFCEEYDAGTSTKVVKIMSEQIKRQYFTLWSGFSLQVALFRILTG